MVADTHFNEEINLIDAQRVLDHLQSQHFFMQVSIYEKENKFFFCKNPNLKIQIQVKENDYSKTLFEDNVLNFKLYTSNLGRVIFDTSLFSVKEFGFFACCKVPFIFTVGTFKNVMRFSLYNPI